jgi:hypothetical protein
MSQGGTFIRPGPVGRGPWDGGHGTGLSLPQTAASRPPSSTP